MAGARVVTVRRVGLALAMSVLGLLAVASPAAAHTVLERSDPAAGSLLRSAPSAVTLTYDEAVTVLPSSVEVFGPDGTRADNGHVVQPGASGRTVAVGLRDTGRRGTYLVSWRVISDDSHPVSGSFTFSIGERSTTPTAHAQHTDRAVAFALGTSRFVGYVACALLVGGLAFVARAWPEGREARGGRVLLLVGALGLLVSSAAALLLKGPYDAGLGLRSIGEGDLMRETLGTTYGHGMLVRLALAFVSAAVLLNLRRLDRASGMVLGVLGVGVLLTYPPTGHAFAGEQRLLAMTSDVLHVGAMAVWLGGLAMLVLPLMRATPTEVSSAVVRFSRMALVCVALLVATGLYQAWREVRSWEALFHTTYGRELLVKTVLVALVVLAASASRAWVTRSQHDAGATPTVGRLRRSVAAEVVLALVVLGVTSALVATEPARTAVLSRE
jgi:copper transport protein